MSRISDSTCGIQKGGLSGGGTRRFLALIGMGCFSLNTSDYQHFFIQVNFSRSDNDIKILHLRLGNEIDLYDDVNAFQRQTRRTFQRPPSCLSASSRNATFVVSRERSFAG